jgi:molybdopterin-guanine dinucleotide biosynthesis protein A
VSFPAITEPLRSQLAALHTSPHDFARSLAVLAIACGAPFHKPEIVEELFATASHLWIQALEHPQVIDATDLLDWMPGVSHDLFADWASEAGLPAEAPELEAQP